MKCPICKVNLSREDDEHPCGEDAENIKRLESENARLVAEIERYEKMFAAANHVKFTYAEEVYIDVYPKRGRAVLHYRDRQETGWKIRPWIRITLVGENGKSLSILSKHLESQEVKNK